MTRMTEVEFTKLLSLAAKESLDREAEVFSSLEAPDMSDAEWLGIKNRSAFRRIGENVKKSLKTVGVAMLAVVCVFALSFGSAMTVKANREAFANIVMTWGEKSVDIDVTFDREVQEFDPIMPTYIPEGYKLRYNSKIDRSRYSFIYQNDDGQAIVYYCYMPSSVSIGVDSEHGCIKENVLLENGLEAMLFSYNDNARNLIWVDESRGICFSVSSDDLSEEELLKFANGLK